MKIKTELTEKQNEILKEFIKTFLPKRGNKRKNPKNEIDYISTTLDKLFKQYFLFNVSQKDVLNAFEELDYQIFSKKGTWDVDQKIYKPALNGDIIKLNDAYDGYEASFIYVDIESPMVRKLMRCTFTLLPSTSQEKLEETEQIKSRLFSFREEMKSKFGGL